MEKYNLTEEDIRRLLAKNCENKNFDYKEGLKWHKDNKDQKSEIVKDILAMANTQDGGKIVIGVRDSDYQFVGMSEDDWKSFDVTKVNDFLQTYTDPKHSCEVVKAKIDGKYVVVIDVPEFNDVPIICAKDAPSLDSSKQMLKKGQIYIRTEKGTSEIVPSELEMRELIGRAMTKRGDELLHQIERLIKGKPITPSDYSEEKYKIEIKEADEFARQSIGLELERYGYWEVYAYPTDYQESRIDLAYLKRLILDQTVRVGSWDFPHSNIRENGMSSFSKGVQSCTNWAIFVECYRIYQSGLISFKKVFEEDIDKKEYDGKKLLGYRGVIFSITEFLLFFKRFYENMAPESSIRIEISLHKVKDRMLFDFSPEHFLAWKIAREEPISIRETVEVVELKASYKEIAKTLIRRIFTIFNLDDFSDSIIEEIQRRY